MHDVLPRGRCGSPSVLRGEQGLGDHDDTCVHARMIALEGDWNVNKFRNAELYIVRSIINDKQ